jgi:hypothetical protein
MTLMQNGGTLSPGEMKERARGALICAAFGSYWMVFAVVYSGHPSASGFVMVGVPALVLIGTAIYHVRLVRPLTKTEADKAHWRSVRKVYWINFALEWGLIFAAGAVIAHLGRMDLIPQVFGVVVGFHFIPLAKVFRSTRCYWTGGAMVIAAVASLLVAPGGLRNILGCCAVGLPLWLTAVAIFATFPKRVTE